MDGNSSRGLLAFLALSAAGWGGFADAAPFTDADFGAVPASFGPDNRVEAMVLDKMGRIYVGGYFTTVDGATVNHVARWDGSQWSALGGGTDGPIYTMTFDSFGKLYVGGEFGTADGHYAPAIAMWDGTQWSGVGGGVSHVVFDLTADLSGDIYASGTLTVAGGMGALHIAKWNGSQWSPLGQGLGQTGGGTVADGWGNVFVPTNSFTTGSGLNVTNAYGRWDGTQWNQVMVQGSFLQIFGDGAGNVYFAGNFTSVDGVSTPGGFAKWNGSQWSSMGSVQPISGMQQLIADGSGNLYAVGDFKAAGSVAARYIAKWDGSKWTALGSGLRDPGIAACLDDSGHLYVLESYTRGSATGNRIVVANLAGGGTPLPWFTDANWSAFSGGGTNGMIHAWAVDPSGNLYVAGDFTTAGGVSASHIAEWNGSSWRRLARGSTIRYGHWVLTARETCLPPATSSRQEESRPITSRSGTVHNGHRWAPEDRTVRMAPCWRSGWTARATSLRAGRYPWRDRRL
jgi:hypothetical protein